MSLPGNITTRLRQTGALATTLTTRQQRLRLGAFRRDISVTQVTTGLTGATGGVQISADPDNALTVGTDGGLYAPYPQLATAQW